MRILRLVSGNDEGGVFICETNFAKEWIKKDITLDYLIVGDGPARKTYESFADKIYFSGGLPAQFTGSPLQILKNSYLIQRHARATAKLLRNALTEKYDAIIYQWPTFIHLASAINKRLEAPIFWHMPGSVNQRMAAAYYTLYCTKNNITPVANSEHTRRSLRRISKHTVYPGFDATRTAMGGYSLRRSLNIPENAIIFGCASRLTESKGPDLLLQALDRADLYKKGVHCVIAGGPLDTEYGRNIIYLAQKHAGQVHLLGHLGNTANFYATIDIFVHSARTQEAFGISIAEAMASSLPIIAYHAGGPAEMIEHGENGWLVTNPILEDYCRAFLTAYRQHHRWAEMGGESNEVSPRFSVAYNAQKFLQIITDRQAHILGI